MRKAIIIFIYNKPEQANLLIEQLLSDKDADVFIHVDKKYEYLKSQLLKDERVIIVNNNISVDWGSDNLLNAHLLVCKEIIKRDIYEYVLTVSGSDMMIREGLNEFLEKHKGEVFIDSFEQDFIRRIYLLRKWPKAMRTLRNNLFDPIRILRRFRIELFKRNYPFSKKKVEYDTSNITFYKCYFWFAMPIEVVNYVIKFVEDNPKFLEIYKGGFVADEGFWATVIMNSPYKDRITYSDGVAKSLTYYGKFTRNHHPPTLAMKDIEELEASGKFFARKFDLNEDKEVIDYFYKKILGV
ncbi:beta-1,6-N-acetylglucosaminyltransferase [Bacillus sp. Marseille-P3661]|uniref:beta-1,6-N-acetylglucosaminyltransferase n=1 Tax=Bacillus sp. Marseille-P3661 TaxID=1936234 RepID=UPI0015E189AD|nr:beta-1,6-N-acetylglucosaminyltransferase [Bacillus sp. Marseille-P3661]